MRHIVILGAGFAGLSALHTLEQATLTRRKLKITLVSNSTHFLFTPLLPNVANSELSLKSITFPLKDHIDPSTELIIEQITGLDLKHNQLLTSSQPIPYDYLLLAPGSETDWKDHEHWKDLCYTCKSAEDAVLIREHIEHTFAKAAQLPKNERQSLLTFAFAGAGPTGVELLAEVYAGLARDVFSKASPDLVQQTRFLLIDPQDQILTNLPTELQKFAHDHLSNTPGISILTNTSVTERTEHEITLSSGETILCDHLFWCAGVKPSSLLQNSNLELDASGRVMTDSTLQALGCENVFVAGDCAAPPEAPAPNAQAAKQQGPVAAQNIIAALSGRAPKTFSFQHLGDMLTLGRGRAAIKVMGVPLQGRVAYAMYRAAYASLMPGAMNKMHILTEWFEHDLATARIMSLPNLPMANLPTTEPADKDTVEE